MVAAAEIFIAFDDPRRDEIGGCRVKAPRRPSQRLANLIGRDVFFVEVEEMT